MWPTISAPTDYLTTTGAIVLLCIAGIGALVAVSTRRTPRARVFFALLASLAAPALLLHATTVLTLHRDPHRDLGRIPIAEPFATLLALLAGLFPYFAAAAGGFVLVRASSRRLSLSWPPRAAAFLVFAYAAYIGPWALEVLLD